MTKTAMPINPAIREWIARETAARHEHEQQNMENGTCYCGGHDSHFHGVHHAVSEWLESGEWPLAWVGEKKAAAFFRHCKYEPPTELVEAAQAAIDATKP